jgi:predicted alpha-1,2-mannosidase
MNPLSCPLKRRHAESVEDATLNLVFHLMPVRANIFISLRGLCLVALSVRAVAGNDGGSVVDYANPIIGTDRDGHVYPGAAIPFGFVQVSPDTPNTSEDWCSGYHYTATNLSGFSNNHLTGTGCPDLGNILFIPSVGKLKLPLKNTPGEGYRARFSHEQEEAHPGYYRVFLPDDKINVELTATTRVGLQRYTFPETAEAHVVLDLWHGLGNHPTDALLTVENDHTVSGFRKEVSDACFQDAGVKEYYFVAEFSKPFEASGIVLNGETTESKEARGPDIKAHFDYITQAGEKLVIRVALSTVSVEGARRNLRAEIDTWDFDAVAAAKEKWDEALGKIQVETRDANLKETFYTALYHTQLTPIVFNDVDGQFRGPDNQVHQASGFDYYTDLSLWDTFRAEQPLLTLLQPRRVSDIVNTMLTHYKLLGQQILPLCAYGGRESYCMIGNPSIPVIAEAYAKGLREWDTNEALAAMVGASERADERHASYAGYGYYRDQGWIPSRPYTGGDNPSQSVSKTLEFAYDDACLARFARSLGRNDIADTHARRSANWLNVFDPATGFMRGRDSDGGWVRPFNPGRINFADYTEANAWQYTFFVPQNVPGLIKAMGGDDKFVAKLDELFDTKEKMPPTSWQYMDGLIGMYWHGNEPCHNFAYLYNYAGQPWKTQRRIRQIAAACYQNGPGGMCGNDDCGQMSAWYVFSVLGFYPVDPPSGVYVIGSPLVDKATVKLDCKFCRGRAFTMIANNNSALNPYIQSATLNGHALTRSWITHQEITDGGKLVLNMGPSPNFGWGASLTDRPAQVLIP